MKIVHNISKLLIAVLLLISVQGVAQYGSYKNGTNATGNASAGNVPVTEISNVTFSFPMIGLGKTAGTPAVQSDGSFNVTYTFTVKNIGNIALRNIQVSDVLDGIFPSPVTYTVKSLTASGGLSAVTVSSYDGTAAHANLLVPASSNLAAGASGTITLGINIKNNGGGYGTYNNTATATAETADATPVFDVSTNSSNPDADNNGTPFNDNTPTPVTLTAPDIAVTKAVNNATPQVGQNVTFTITVKNTGGDAGGVVVNDLLPTGYTYVSHNTVTGTYAQGTGVWTVGNLKSSDGIKTLTITAKVNASGVYTNTATNTQSGDSNTSNNTASASTTPVPVTDLQVAKSASNLSPNVNAGITFTLNAKNNGPSDATNVVVTDVLKTGFTIGTPLPSGVTFNSTTNTITWTIGNLANGASATSVVIPVTVNPNVAATEYVNTATITGTELDNTTTNNTSTVTVTPVPLTDLKIEKTLTAASPLYAGDNVTFTLTATNNGPSDATGVKVTDALKPGYTFVSASATQGSYDNNTGVWTIGAVTHSSAVTLTITAKVKATGAYDNTATVTGNETDTDASNNTASTTAPTVLPRTDLQVIKTVDNATPYAGNNVVFTITVTNNGPSAATGVNVTDALKSGYTFVSASATQGSYSNATGAWTIGNVANAGTAVLSITAKVNASGDYTNTATVAGNEYDDVTANNTSSASTTPVASTDLSVTKTVDATAPLAGSVVTFTIVAKNNGPSNATGVTVTDLLPSGYTFVSASPSQGSYSPVNGEWNIGSLSNASTATLSVMASVRATGGYLNSATITGTQYDSDLSNNASSVTPSTVPVADISVVKTASTNTPDVGTVVSFNIQVTNNGPSAATNVVITDALKTGYTFVSAVPSAGIFNAGTNKWTVGAMTNGAIETLTITATVNASGAYDNTASVTNPETDNVTSNNTSTITPVPVPITDLQVLKTVSNATPYVGDNVTFTVTVTNNGPSAATNVKVTDLLKSGYTYVSATVSTGSYAQGTGIWTIGNLTNGGTATMAVTARVNAAGDYNNTADVTGTETDRTLTNNTATSTTIPVPVTDLQVTKSIDNTTPDAGSQVIFTIGVQNNGPSDATGVKVNDLLPAGYTFVSATPTQGTYNSTTGVWTIGNLALNASTSMQVTATVVADRIATDYTNTAIVSGTETDNTASNNTASATSTPVPVMDLQVTNTVTRNVINIGDAITYTVTVTNNGPSNATGVKLTDLVNAGFTAVNYTVGTGTINAATGVWTIGSLASGASVTLTITATGQTPGTYNTPAAVTGNENESTLANNNAGVSVKINLPPTAKNDSVKTHINVPVNIDILANDVIGDGALDPATVTIVANVAHGTLTIDPLTGKVLYTPAAGYYGDDQFTYTVKDINGAISNIATVKIEIGKPPLANNDAATTNPNTPVTLDLLANDVKQDLDLDAATTTVVANPQHGTVTVDPLTGKATYTPATDYFGTDNFTYYVKDINGILSNIATAVITINKPPTAVNDAAATNPNTAVTLNSLSNDAIGDAALVPSTLAIVKQPDHGTLSIDPTTGNVRYTPATDYFGTDTYTYTVKDANGAISNVATGTITINKPPTATNDAAATNPNTPVIVNSLANDVVGDAALVPPTLVITKQPDHGILTIDPATGNITYTPATDYYGTDTYKYTIKDANGAISNVATGTITINKPPVANDEFAKTHTNTPVDINILNNDVPGDAALVAATITIVKQPDHGTLTIDPVTGKVTYTPATNYYGVDTFTYTVKDANGAISNVAKVALEIGRPPVTNDDHAATNPNTAVIIDLLVNDLKQDLDIAPATTTVIKQPDHGTVTIDPLTGKATYTPAPGYYGTDNFTYTVKDINGSVSNVSTVNIVINKPPTAVNDAAITNPNTPVVIDVLSNDTKGDANLAPATVAIVKQPDHGTLTIDPATGKVTYTPATDYYGKDTFTYTVKDANGAISNVATGSIVINKPPTAVDESAVTNPNTPVVLTVLSNDVAGDAALVPATVTIVKQPDHGTVSINAVTGNITYTPATNYFGTDSYTYTVKDANGAISNVATDKITINKPPTAVNDAATTNPGKPVTIPTLANDTKGDANLVASTVTIVTNPAHGTVTIDPVTGNVIYTPANGFNGNDTYTYTVKDANGAISNIATVTIHVNKPPVANNDAATTEEPTPVTISVTGNDVSEDGIIDKTSIAVITSVSHGSIVVNNDGTVIYTPTEGYEGQDSFTYTVKDNNGNTTNIATVTITVTKRKIDLSIEKKVVTTKTAIEVGKNIQFDITVKNLSAKTASGVQVTDILPANLGGLNVQVTTTTGTATYNAAGKQIAWQIGTFQAGATATLSVTAQVISGGKIENTATVQGADTDPNLSNNSSTATAEYEATKDDLFIPTVFTPNGDGKNDKFVILGLDRFPGSPVMIYNRWGNMVYQSNNYKNDWDGSGLNDGTYYYILKLNTPTGQKVYKGWVEVIH